MLVAQWTPASASPQSQTTYPQSGPSQSQYPDASQGQPADRAATDENPDPADLQHGVARVSVVQGDVNVRRGDNNQLTGAVMNAPLLARDHLETSPGSRAEVQFDSGTILRLAPNTDVGFADIQYHRAEVQLALGTIIFRVLASAATQVEIDTPSVGIRPVTQGEYRISVFDNGTSEVTVRVGQIQLSGPRGTEQIDAGQSVLVRSDASDPEMQVAPEIVRDQFDEWSENRDQGYVAPQSARYVSADVQGTADLDQYGNWVTSGYGQVWRPQGVATDWSPYSNGQWSYVDYYGWSWIDYSPWGWAPYHYGRWFWNTGYGWCWWPGERGYQAYWSPALVSFFGFGGRVGFGFGGLGWVALAPFERCHRWWGGGGYGDSYHHVGYGLSSYRNASIRGGAMTARYNAFAGTGQRFVAASRSELSAASSITGRLPFRATAASLNYSARSPVANSRFASVQSRSFYHNTSGGNFRTLGSSPTPRSYASPTARYSGSSGAGWQHFGSPGNSSSYRQSFQTPETSGWHRFGQPQHSENGTVSSRGRSAPAYQQPSYSYRSAAPPRSSYTEPRYSYATPSYSTRPYQQPHYSYQTPAPRQSYNAPRQTYSAPHYSAPSAGPRGGGGFSSHAGSGGGGGHHR